MLKEYYEIVGEPPRPVISTDNDVAKLFEKRKTILDLGWSSSDDDEGPTPLKDMAQAEPLGKKQVKVKVMGRHSEARRRR